MHFVFVFFFIVYKTEIITHDQEDYTSCTRNDSMTNFISNVMSRLYITVLSFMKFYSFVT